jgi:hypothetical protein
VLVSSERDSNGAIRTIEIPWSWASTSANCILTPADADIEDYVLAIEMLSSLRVHVGSFMRMLSGMDI